MSLRRYAILEAPSTLGLRSDGVAGLAGRMIELGLGVRINARHAGCVMPPARPAERDPATGILNASAIAEYSPRLADEMGELLAAGDFPLLLGGDCTILLGPMLALRRKGRYGLLFIDGHADFFQPEAEPNGEGASMDLAWATGYGPAIVADIEQRRPLVRSADVVAFGFRDHDDQREYHSQPLPADMLVLDLPALRKIGVEAAARRAVERLSDSDLDGFFIHLDADALDDTLMPAVDFRVPSGLSADELRTVLTIALGSVKAVGLELTIYNPELDKDGRAGRLLAELLGDVLSSA